jgi:hypothetical protein
VGDQFGDVLQGRGRSCRGGRSRRPAARRPGRGGTPATRCPSPGVPGPIRWPRRIRRTVDSPIRWPRRRSSPCTRRYPHRGFSRASLQINSRIWLCGDGRPGRFGYCHLRATRRRCQASSVAGVTSRCPRSCRGSSRAHAARTARSGQEGRGRSTCRRKTATSCRNVSNSAVTADSLRARTVSHRNRHIMIR